MKSTQSKPLTQYHGAPRGMGAKWHAALGPFSRGMKLLCLCVFRLGRNRYVVMMAMNLDIEVAVGWL